MNDTSQSIVEAKAILRREMKIFLTSLAPSEVKLASSAIVEQLSAGEWLPANSVVALFGGIQGEPDLRPLISWLKSAGATPVFFEFTQNALVPRAIAHSEELLPGAYGTWNPPPNAPEVHTRDLDVVLVPGLAFDARGGRLGRGRGYFDRLFADPHLSARRIGVCLDRQVVDFVPCESHDARMHVLITESKVTLIEN